MANTFGSFADVANQIKTEGETITLKFEQGVPNSGQGTVSWNIPTPAAGCDSETGGVYSGMVILLSTEPLSASNIPQDGKFYVHDNTADVDAHLGDTISNALVVGAFYEEEKKNRGEALTTSFVVNDLQPNTTYYVAGYAVDAQARYHSDGVRAYSDALSGLKEPNTPAYQTVSVGSKILPTDGTGLVPGMIYEFEMLVDPSFPKGTSSRLMKFSADGLNIQTYGDFVDEFNKQAALIDNPPQSPVPINQGRFYWNGEALFVWDGSQNVPQDVIIESSDPSNVSDGVYWFNGTTLQQRTAGVWEPISLVTYSQDPTDLGGGNDYWFNGTQGYKWCGKTWCEQATYMQSTDPVDVQSPEDCGHYWYDSENGILYEYNLDSCKWEETFALTWHEAPNALSENTYWFDDVNEKLFVRFGSPVGWAEINDFIIGEVEPAQVDIVDGLHWYDTAADEFKVFVGSTMEWVDINPIMLDEDPTNVESCELWWNSTDGELYKWDSVNNEWDTVVSFVQTDIDPLTPPTMDKGTLWYNTATLTLSEWNGVAWNQVEFVDNVNDPVVPTTGTAWHNPETGAIHIWGGTMWIMIDPIDSVTDPSVLPTGIFWFDTSTNTLNQRNGLSWMSVMYTNQPLAPLRGSKWYDLTNNKLMVWDGTKWVEDTQLVFAKVNSYGKIQFESAFTGSSSCIQILVPKGSASGVAQGNYATGTASFDSEPIHDYLHWGMYEGEKLLSTSIPPDRFLFDFLMQGAHINQQTYGTDGVSSTPSYEMIGVGDDGTPDEKRELMDSLLHQLGYPTVEVELTKQQLNTAIDRSLEVLRSHSSVAYKRGFFFLNVKRKQQHYKLTNQTVGFHKIVTVMSAHRMTSAFLSSAHGSGVYGQVVLQHLYNMGTFDLLSFHLVSQYIEQMEHLFATRLVFNFDEYSREIQFHNAFSAKEKVLLDVMVERTEQEIIQNRWAKNWIENYALAEAKMMLSQIRGKFASLPGAGGGISLNAADLANEATMLKEQCMMEIDDYIVNDPENVGIGSTFVIG